jgi:hypothetical protein
MTGLAKDYRQELDGQADSARIQHMWGQIARKGYGTNPVRAKIKDLIDERDALNSVSDRKVAAQKIMLVCDKLIQAEQAPLIEDQRAEWLDKGMVNVTTASAPDATGRRFVRTSYPDGYSETLIFENDEDWSEHLTNEVHTAALEEKERRELKFQKVPEELRPLVNDPEALFSHMQEQREGESSLQRAKRVADELKTLRPAMTKAAYARLSDLASGRSEGQTTIIHEEP